MNSIVTQQEVQFSSFQMDRMGLRPIGNPSFNEWVRCGEFLKNANGAVHFWIGDWMNYGERQWGEMYAQAIDETGYSYGTLANDKWVTACIEPSRRRESLSFAHHQEVADLMPEDQEKMLTMAVEQGMNSKDFRIAVRSYKLRLDLPELTDEELSKAAHEDFNKAQRCVMLLIEATEESVKLDLKNFDPDARDFLLSQVRKTVGRLGSLVT